MILVYLSGARTVASYLQAAAATNVVSKRDATFSSESAGWLSRISNASASAVTPTCTVSPSLLTIQDACPNQPVNHQSIQTELTRHTHRIIPRNNFCASGNNTSARTTRAIARAPYTSEYPFFTNHARAASSTSSVIRLSLNRSATSFSRRATTSKMALRESLLNTSIASRRLSSSGGKYSDVRSMTSALATSVTMPFASQEERSARMSLPRLLVRHMIVF